MLAGRDFDARDRFDGSNAEQMPSVAIVNRSFAEHFFGKQSPIGRHIGQGDSSQAKPRVQIVGEVENSLYDGPRDGVPRQVFWAHSGFGRLRRVWWKCWRLTACFLARSETEMGCVSLLPGSPGGPLSSPSSIRMTHRISRGPETYPMFTNSVDSFLSPPLLAVCPSCVMAFVTVEIPCACSSEAWAICCMTCSMRCASASIAVRDVVTR